MVHFATTRRILALIALLFVLLPLLIEFISPEMLGILRRNLQAAVLNISDRSKAHLKSDFIVILSNLFYFILFCFVLVCTHIRKQYIHGYAVLSLRYSSHQLQ